MSTSTIAEQEANENRAAVEPSEDHRLPLWWLYTVYGGIAFALVRWLCTAHAG